jgi:hypothetical protein
MVYVLDEGSEFDAPLERIWKYLRSGEEHEHKAIKVVGIEMQGENVVVETMDLFLENVPASRHKIKMTTHPPFGLVMEYIEGPMTGTRAFQYYIPRGNKTGVTVVGDYVAKGMDDESVKQMALRFLDVAFNEDNENLKKLVAVTV